ncbi:cytochrome b5 reductase 4-like [Brevipalpus obovatus]|uniref:cytochrome b5 reductase 4-like n=1 Tax=Brevipalpus obovatus TaxID=246614 RepID=UPI003D9EDCCD
MSERGKKRIILPPGHSILDWIRLTAAHADLSGTGGKMPIVSVKELEKHSKRTDCWICINRAVYNVTPYMDFHPGGIDQMMRGAGKDCTDLFNSVHSWVNYGGMLKKCYVGKLQEGTFAPKASLDEEIKIPKEKESDKSDSKNENIQSSSKGDRGDQVNDKNLDKESKEMKIDTSDVDPPKSEQL